MSKGTNKFFVDSGWYISYHMDMETFSTFDIVKIFGIPRERLKDWMTHGFFEPSVYKAEGRGTKNLFHKIDLVQIALFQYLLSQGFIRHRAAAYAASWKSCEEKRNRANPYRGNLRDILVIIECGSGENINNFSDQSEMADPIKNRFELMLPIRKYKSSDFISATFFSDKQSISIAVNMITSGLPGSHSFFSEIEDMLVDLVGASNRLLDKRDFISGDWTDIKIVNIGRLILSVDASIKNYKG